MKLPYITIEYREETSFAVGKMSAGLVVGFGLHWAWVYLVMYNGLSLLGISSSPVSAYAFPLSLVVFIATFFGYAFFFKQARKLFYTSYQRKRNRLLAACMMLVSVILLYGTALPGMWGVVSVVLFGVLSGIGSVVLLMSFGVSFSVCDIPTASVSVALSLLVLMGVYGVVLVVNSLAYPAGLIICMIIPLLELGCLAQCSRQLVDNLEFQMMTLPVRKGPFGLRLVPPCLVLGMVLGVLRARVVSIDTVSLALGDFAITVVLAGIAACLLIILAMLTQRQTANFMFRTLFPLIALFLALSASPLAQDEAFSLFVLFTAYIMLESCVWLLIVDISQKYRISAFLAFGFGRGAAALGTLAVVAFKVGLPAVYAQADDVAVITIVLLVLLMLGYALVPSNSELRSILSKGKACPAFASQDDFAFMNNAGQANMSSLAQGVESAVKANTSVQPVFSQVDVPLSGVQPAPAGGSDTKGATTQSVRPGAFAGGAGAVGVTAMDAVTIKDGAAAYASETTPSASSTPANAGDTSVPTEESDLSSPERLGRYKRKCLAVANTYLLSRKETEVLFLLAKGHNSAAIQKKLYISAGTANTHMRNIYRKLSIHSQQDLIALVESTAEETDA